MSPDDTQVERDLLTGAERRRYFRLNKIMPARLEELSPDGGRQPGAREWRVRLMDISAGGFRASHPSLIRSGHPLLAEIYLHPTEPVRATCTICWDRMVASTYELGFEFGDVPEADWKRIVEFIVAEHASGGDGLPVSWLEET